MSGKAPVSGNDVGKGVHCRETVSGKAPVSGEMSGEMSGKAPSIGK